MSNEARFEVFPEMGEATVHQAEVETQTAYHPNGDPYTVATASCEWCDWTARGDEKDVTDAAVSHEHPHSDPTGEFCWRFRAANGRITFIGGESFTRREDARRAAEGVCSAIVLLVVPGAGEGLTIKAAPIVDLDEHGAGVC